MFEQVLLSCSSNENDENFLFKLIEDIFVYC